MLEYFLWACTLGALSAVSLPLGSWFGIRFRFSNGVISVLAAFGAGALLAALSVELIAPAATAITEGNAGERAAHQEYFLALVAGCIIGGLVYVLLDKAVNSKGGFLRRRATVYRYYRRLNREQQHEFIEKLSDIPLFRNFPAGHIDTLLASLEPESYKDGDVIAGEGEQADATYVVLRGTIEAQRRDEKVAELTPEHVILNLIPMLTNTPVIGTGIARGEVRVLRISRESFNRLRQLSPDFDAACREIAVKRLKDLEQLVANEQHRVTDWFETAAKSVTAGEKVPNAPELRRMKEEHHGAPLAIWLGMTLDGIPESLVIGAGMLALVSAKLAATGTVSFGEVIPYTLIAGLFLSNFPEALSSSANMLAQGFSKARIMFLWVSLLLITAAGAGAGCLLAGVLDHTWLALFEGMAAGAMLTMIAAAMIPEAVLLGAGNIVGLSTLAGFLAAVSFKLLEA